MTNENIAMILSLIGMIITIISFQAKNKVPLLILQTIGSSFYLLSYVFNASGIGAIINVVNLGRNFVYMFTENKPRKVQNLLCICFSLAYVLSYVLFTAIASLPLADNLWNLFPVGASLFGTVATANTDVNKYRMWKYGDSLCWLIFNSHIGLGALGGILGEIFNQISLTVGLIRFRKNKKHP